MSDELDRILHLYGDVCGQIALSKIEVPDRNTRIREHARDTKAQIEAYISKHYFKKEDVLEAIETNQKGQFEDDAGHICWYLDDLVSAIKKLNIGDK